MLYATSLRFGFTYMDDDVLILDRLSFLRNIGNFFQVFRHDVFFQPGGTGAFYRPLLTLSFMLDAQFGGADLFVYHLTNLILHLLTSILLFRLLLKMKYNVTPAFYFSLFFTLHPAISQTVYWIPGRNDSLLAVFSLSAFITVLNFWETNRRSYAAWHILLFTLALFTKETAVALIPVCLLYQLWMDDKPLASTDSFLTLGWGTTVTICFLFRHFILENPPNIFALVSGMAANILIVLPYLGNILFPVHIVVLAGQRDMPVIYGLITIGIIACALAASKKKRWNRIAFGFAWFLLFLLPSNGLYNSYFMAHRMYLPFLGIIIVFLEIDWVKDFKGMGIAVLGIITVAVFPTITLLHGRNFKDRISFWYSAAANSPTSEVTQEGFANALASVGKMNEAVVYYEKALQINPAYSKAHESLACFLAEQGRNEEAAEHYQKALSIAPKSAGVYNNWGMLLAKQGRVSEAVARYRHALWLRPDFAEAQYNWGCALAESHDWEKAITHFREAVSIKPDYGEAYNNWGVALSRQGREEESASCYQEALRINPANASAHYNWGLALYGLGRVEEAVVHYRAAIRLKPDYPEPHNNLGIILIKTGRLDEALHHFHKALKVAPAYSRAQENLDIALALKRHSRNYRTHSLFNGALRL